MYKIVRDFTHKKLEDGHLKTSKRTIKKGLTLDEAQAHCRDPKTHIKGYPPGQDKYKGKYRNWFDTYTEA